MPRETLGDGISRAPFKMMRRTVLKVEGERRRQRGGRGAREGEGGRQGDEGR